MAGAGYSDRRDLYRRDKCALQKTPSDERMTSGDRRTRLCGRRLSTMSIVHDQRFHDQRLETRSNGCVARVPYPRRRSTRQAAKREMMMLPIHRRVPICR